MKGLFYGIGHQPNSQLVAGQIDLDDHGYVKVLASVRLASHALLLSVFVAACKGCCCATAQCAEIWLNYTSS